MGYLKIEQTLLLKVARPNANRYKGSVQYTCHFIRSP